MAFLEKSRLKAARALTAEVAKHLGGDLSLELWNGEVLPLGPNARDDVRIVVRSPAAVRRLMLKPSLTTIFELYATDELDVTGANLIDATRRFDHFKSLDVGKNVDRKIAIRAALPFLLSAPGRAQVAGFDKKISSSVAAGRDDKELIQFHYDVSNEFYERFLDVNMVYTCAYFKTRETSLDEAQVTKMDRVCKKLRLKPGERFLDIGCGWGGLLIHAAKNYGITGLGVTLSKAQHDYAAAKIAELGLSDRIRVELKDFREVAPDQPFDKLSAIGLFEHVGTDNHDGHFKKINQLLRPRGLYLHHSVTRWATPDLAKFREQTRYQKVITRFVFPGAELDYVGRTHTNLERHGFEIHDVEGMREHYQLTLEHWLERLYQRRDEAIAEIGMAKTRLWLLYFTLFARGFERGTIGIFQTLASKRNTGPTGLALARGDLP